MNQLITFHFPSSITISVKREDLIHPYVSGNKLRKLKYNLLEAKNQNQQTLLTFGGAFSNHIAALAYAAKENGLKSIGIIRGEELKNKMDHNPTLQFAQQCGMQLEFVSREVYRNKQDQDFLSELEAQFGDFYLVPEGGTNQLAIKGCEEILTREDDCFDYICCAVGTGGTISGIINSAQPHQKILGFPALKGDFLQDEICNFVQNKNWELITDYHFGGYGKVNGELIVFINDFFEQSKIPLDPIYTGKMFFGVMKMIESNYFPPHSKIVLIHTGGLQGIQGMNNKLINKKLPVINVHV